MTQFLEELAAVPAGGGGYCDGQEAGAAVDGKIGEKKLLRVYRMVEGQTKEFEIDAKKDASVGAKTDSPDVEVGDGGAG